MRELETTQVTRTRANRIKVNIRASRIRVNIRANRIKVNIKDRLTRVQLIRAQAIKAIQTVNTIRPLPARDMLAVLPRVPMGTIPITRMPAPRTVSTARGGSLAESSLVWDRGITGAGVMADIGVTRATGDMRHGVTQAGVTDTATLVDMREAMPMEHTAIVTRVADITVASCGEAGASTETLEVDFTGATDSTVGADTLGAATVVDTGN
jgi:hypothetical protein